MEDSKNITLKQENAPFILTIIGAALMTISVFLPYGASKTLSASAVKLAFEYYDYYGALGILYISLALLICLFSLLCLIFAIRKKHIKTIVFGSLSFLIFLLQSWDYKDRGVIGGFSVKWGMGFYIPFVAFALVLAGSIILLIIKQKEKKPHRKNIKNIKNEENQKNG